MIEFEKLLEIELDILIERKIALKAELDKTCIIINEIKKKINRSNKGKIHKPLIRVKPMK